jgi:8-oxo-dGTP pyrophosphatase MutT (NUDIX family)
MRIGPDGYRLVLLITSRETRRWVLPKGWPRPGMPPYRQAAREAFEEAGVTGTVGRTPIGRYSYAKRLRNGRTIPCRVDVFPLAVEKTLDDWPERGQRDVAWFTLGEAATLVEEHDLAALLLDVAAGYHDHRGSIIRLLEAASLQPQDRRVEPETGRALDGRRDG